MIRETIFTLDRGVLLPKLYNYPSVSYWLTFPGLIPDMNEILFENADPATIVLTLGEDYYLRTRLVFLLVSALAIVWVYLTMYAWQKNAFQALIAACIPGFSWEFAYHARWIAPDAILMQFAALTILFTVLAILNPEKKRYLYFAAIAAGLATGTKYTGGLLLIPVGLAVVKVLFSHIASVNNSGMDKNEVTDSMYAVPTNETPVGTRYIASVMFLIIMPLLFFLTYLITTPGTLLDSDEFWKDVRFEMRHYGEVGHEDQTVDPGADHLGKNLSYLSRAALSWYDGISLLLIAFMLLGIYAAGRENFYLTLLLLSFPVIYVLYMSNQRVMFVRNLLVVFPFMAIFAAQGISFLYKISRFRVLKVGLITAVIAIFAINAFWLYTAAKSIAERENNDVFDEFITYAAEHPDTKFSISDRIKGDMDNENMPLPENMAVSAWDTDYDYGVFYAWEVRTILPPNHPDTLSRWFGPHEINLNYYPLWENHYVLVLPSEKVTEYFVPVFKKNSAG